MYQVKSNQKIGGMGAKPVPVKARPVSKHSGTPGKTVTGRLDNRTVIVKPKKGDAMNIRCREAVREAMAEVKRKTRRSIVDIFDEMVCVYVPKAFGVAVDERSD